MTSAALTDRQQAVLSFVEVFTAQHGYPPTRKEIAAHFGFNVNSAEGHLAALEAKGHLIITPGIARGIVCTGK